MVVLSFSKAMIGQIMLGKKITTIRHNVEYWIRQYEKGNILHIWSPSPRTGKGVFYGTSEFVDLVVCKGMKFNNVMAWRDGFKTKEELVDTLGTLHTMTLDEVLQNDWAVIEFEEYNYWTPGSDEVPVRDKCADKWFVPKRLEDFGIRDKSGDY